ncbi:MAG: NTP transferase domain-containing protein, partial [Halobacteriovoraceae bacterium]|nr:NTP transferase domain-containing protein [Halobacteriovoraceae bacterium]
MIQVLMPMAGAGSRFKDFHQFPKPLIPVFEQPMFYWNCKLLQKYIKEVSFTFVVLKSHVESYQIDQKIKEIIPSANICIIPKLTEGALETAHACREQLDLESPLLITDCDLCFLAPEFFDFLNRGLFEAAAGALVSFESDLPRYSYAKLENNQVVKTAEKEVIS